MSNSLKILAFFAIGVLLAYMKYLPQWAIENDFSSYALYLLMFLVGIGIGGDERAMKALKQFNLRLFMVPLTTITGTLIGVSIVYGFLGNISFPEVLAVGAGFGYYSLSSIIITDIKGAEPGVIALLSNVMREIITLLFAPIFVKVFGKLAPICSGGATSMDTTLPIISYASGREYAIVSLFHGILLTIIVPFLVTFILSF